MTDKTRRSILKTLAYGAALSTGVASSLAFASNVKPTDISQKIEAPNTAKNVAQSTLSGVTIYQQGTGLDQSVSLMNLTDEDIYLHQMAPISVESVDGSSRIKVNTVSQQSGIVLEAGQRVSFELSNQASELASISSEHPAFNGSILSTVA
ncbi:MAG: hypothetical protein V3V19_08785 [Cocleimonas sp.]